MNKAILMSIQPQHAVNILKGKKTLELRKTVPKNFKGWVYIYCTKSKKQFRVGSLGFYEDVLYKLPNGQIKFGFPYGNEKKIILNGKVVARFWFDEYDEVEITKITRTVTDRLTIRIKVVEKYNYELSDLMLNKLYLTEEEIINYGKGKDLYAWHIKDLEIFKDPMELSEFYRIKNDYKQEITPVSKTNFIRNNENYKMMLDTFKVKRPPQSWQYVYVEGEEG